MYYPIWHWEVESLLVLKNNRGVEDNRARHLDYGVQLNKTMYKRVQKNEQITLFSPNDVPGLYDAFFEDQDEFERLYTQYENDPNIRKRQVSALELFSTLMKERADTGRIYIMNVDHCNTHSPFDPKQAPIRQSNLCVSGDTPILIKKDGVKQEVPISQLEKQTVMVYNGEQFLQAYVDKTSEASKLIAVNVKHVDIDGNVIRETVIKATPEHKWLFDGNEYTTQWLMDNKHTFFELPGIPMYGDSGYKLDCGGHILQEDGSIYNTDVYLSGFKLLEGEHPTWCFNQPEDHTGVFDGVLTGQCLEIALPTKPLKDINDVDGEISLCTLAAINLGVTSMDEFEAVADLLVRALDNLLDYQSYPVKAAELSTMKRRPLGIGVINYAYWLAKNGTYYSDLEKGNKLTHELFEKLQYSLLKASNGLAKEKSACPGFSETTYAKGLLPIDTYKKDLDDVVANDLKCDWETLRQDIVKYGLRNSTLTAIAPTESSSQVSNSTNGIEPPRGLLTVKASKDGILKQIVPEYETLGLNYETAWEMTNYKGYIQKVCIMQKFIDQAISANEYFDPKKYPNNKPSLQEMITNKLYGYKYGIKTWYYHNTRDGADDVQSDLTGGCESGACSV